MICFLKKKILLKKIKVFLRHQIFFVKIRCLKPNNLQKKNVL